MGNGLSNLWMKIGRMGKKQFSLYHLYMILSVLVLVFISNVMGHVLGGVLFFLCGNYNCIPWLGILIEYIFYGILFLFIFLSNLFLAKRFQDCGICGKRVFVLRTLPIILIFLLYIFGINFHYILEALHPTISIPLAFCLLLLSLSVMSYPIILIVMFFKEGNVDSNKYGNVV